jgi:protein-S-isoprenylcysteine O-methyltransferase Ste14
MYVALVTMMCGMAFYNANPLNLIGALIVAVAVAAKARREEKLLIEAFPDYQRYASKTGRFLPVPAAYRRD